MDFPKVSVPETVGSFPSNPLNVESSSHGVDVKDSYDFDSGKLEIFFGPMFSGKTTRLLNELTTCSDVGLKCLYINHSLDQRQVSKTDGIVTTHHGSFKGINENIDAIKIGFLSEIEVMKYDVIGIDEGQFFDDIVTSVRKWVIDFKKHVFISSLDGDSNIRPFGHVHELICLCHPGCLHKLSAKCMSCLKDGIKERHLTFVPAGFSFKRLGDREKQNEVGGADKYMATCLKCHLNKSQIP